jgi:hypothetical protein
MQRSFGSYKAQRLKQHKRSLFSCSVFHFSILFPKREPWQRNALNLWTAPTFSLHGKSNLKQQNTARSVLFDNAHHLPKLRNVDGRWMKYEYKALVERP